MLNYNKLEIKKKEEVKTIIVNIAAINIETNREMCRQSSILVSTTKRQTNKGTRCLTPDA